MIATAGLQRGSMSIIVASDSSIHRLSDLRGQKVAAATRWQFMFGQPFATAGLNPNRDIEWQPPLPPTKAAEALKARQVAVAMVHQPYPAALESSDIGRILLAQNSPPLQDDYFCCVILPRGLERADPKKAAAITRALMRGSAWIRSHPSEGARLEVDMKHVSGGLADNERAMASLDFFPSVGTARRNTLDILQRFKRLGFIDSATDELSVLDQIFIPVIQEL